MRDRSLCALLSAIALSTGATSVAAADSTPSVNSLTTPDSPAFVILGVSPTSIQRPTTPSAVAASLVNAFTSNGTTLAPNYALEVSPYWLWSHPQRTWEDVAKQSYSTPLDTLAVSFGTSSSAGATSSSTSSTASSSATSSTPKAAIGLKTTLIQGNAPQAAYDCLKSLGVEAGSVARAVSGATSQWYSDRTSALTKTWSDAFVDGGAKASLQAQLANVVNAAGLKTLTVTSNPHPAPAIPHDVASAWISWNQLPNDDADLTQKETAWKSALDASWANGWAAGWKAAANVPVPQPPQRPTGAADTLPATTLASVSKQATDKAAIDGSKCLKSLTSREGFVLDAAAAAAMAFPSGVVDNGKLSTYSLWTTAAFLSTNLSGLGVLRFMQDNLYLAGQHTTSLDAGARGIVAVTRFGFSGEGVYRIPLDSNTSKNQYRIDVAAEVELFDGYWFSVSGGHDFIDGSDWTKFFAVANFKGTFGPKPTVTTN